MSDVVSYFLEEMSRRMVEEIDKEIWDQLLRDIRGWDYYVPNFVYYVPPPTVYAGVE